MGPLVVPGLAALPAPSALLTSWWAVDHLLTPHPGDIYRGTVEQVVSERSVRYALEGSVGGLGPFRARTLQRGMGIWVAEGEGEAGPLRLRIPSALDTPDRRGRSRLALPERATEHARRFHGEGLTRYLTLPSRVVRLDGSLPVAAWDADSAFRPLTFREGRWEHFDEVVAPEHAAELATALTAALAYYYFPEVDGGSTVADVVINEGDVHACQQADGSFSLRLDLVRHLEHGVPPEIFLLQLVQLYAYESCRVGGDDLGMPVVVSNPSLAFAGLLRGWQERALDLGHSEVDAHAQATSWIRQFSRAPVGRSYRRFAEQFLAGELPPRFGVDPREGQIDLGPLRQRQLVLSLGARLLTRPDQDASAREYEAFIAGRSEKMRERAALVPESVANPENFGNVLIPEQEESQALEVFPTFEDFMDLCLHDPEWGYYGHHVQIGHRGHFDTHPEALSPHYGTWLAERAYAACEELASSGELAPGAPFVLVEFGAGNGRLARDILDAVRRKTEEGDDASRAKWRAFAARFEYRIYELSAGLAERQRALLGKDAVVTSGDARRAEACLRRDFSDGLRGLVLTNEVPDAFGVHKVFFREGQPALAALVVPRLDAAVRATLPADLGERVIAADRRIRGGFQLRAYEGEEFLDGATLGALMTHLARCPSSARDPVLSGLWFEEVYVRAAAILPLARHLAEGDADTRRALAEASSPLLMYVNVHAADFIRGVGAALAAGFVITIDYGGSVTELARTLREGRLCFRVYGPSASAHSPRVNDPYVLPGGQDLTADVNFTDLARVGRSVGLEVLHYGPEIDLVGAALPEVLAAPSPTYAPLLDEAGFKILVQGTRKSTWFWTQPGSGLDLE